MNEVMAKATGTAAPINNRSLLGDEDIIWPLLAASADLSISLKAVLKLILQAVGRPGGALIYAAGKAGGSPVVVSHHAPQPWAETLSTLFFDRTTGDMQPAEFFAEWPDLAGYSEICTGENGGGWLLICGPALRTAEVDRLSGLSQKLGAALQENKRFQFKIACEKSLSFLESVVSAQNTLSDSDQVQIAIAGAMLELSQGEAIVINTLDFENPEIFKKSVYAGNGAWVRQSHFALENSLLAKSIANHSPLYIRSVLEAPDYRPELDGLTWVEGLTVRSLVLMPLITNETVIGAVTVVNSEELFLEELLQEYLSIFATSLANSLFNIKLVHDFKIVNADLEASRMELMKSRNMLRSLFDHMPASLYIIDRNYVIQSINKHRSDRVKEQPSRLWGRKCYESLHNLAAPCENCRVKETFNLCTNTLRNSREPMNNQRFIEWEINTYPILDSKGQVALTILFEQDVTDRRQLEAKLLQNEKLAIIGQLAAGVAHEINNPLSAIIANIQLIKREGAISNESIAESINLIDIASLRASQVVTNLLSFSRKEQLHFAACDLNQTIRNAIALVQHEFLVRPTHLSLELAENLPQLMGSKENLQAVWTNLLLNSLDAMTHDHREVRIRTMYANKEFRVEFSDNGGGIPTDRIPLIFEPFYTTKESGRGTGLGLSVCQQVIKQHGGFMKVESDVGVGTRFIATIPHDSTHRN